MPAEARLIRRVHDTVRLYDDGQRPVILPVTQEELATMAGTTRPTANRALRQLERAGMVALGRGKIEVHYPEEIARQAR